MASETLAGLGDGHTRPELNLCKPQDGSEPGFASGREIHADQSFEDYAKAIHSYPKEFFDLIVVDGRARMACLRECVDHLAPGGAILLDNSDYARYQTELQSFEAEFATRFERRDFLSPTPFAANIGSQTTLFFDQTG